MSATQSVLLFGLSVVLACGLTVPLRANAQAPSTPVPPVDPKVASRVEPTFVVKSSVDGVEQPCFFVPTKSSERRPLLVFLHPWSNGFNTCDMSAWQNEAAARDWHYLQPHFRGPNWTPEACGSAKARQDILDAVDYVLACYSVDKSRVYLAGGSGGGHMTLVMAAHAPERWAAASAWCPISDLAAWHAEKTVDTNVGNQKYARDIEASVGGAPGSSEAVDKELIYRSPVHHLQHVGDLPLEIATGIHDGHTGSVPIHHTIDAFNAVAKAHGDAVVSAEEIATLSAEKPLTSQEEQDPTFGRAVYLRRYSGPCRVTIFEGGHEGLPPAACAWLEQHSRNQ